MDERWETTRYIEGKGLEWRWWKCSLREYKRQGTKAGDTKVWERGNGGKVRQADINTDTDMQILAERKRNTG